MSKWGRHQQPQSVESSGLLYDFLDSLLRLNSKIVLSPAAGCAT
jgi:hypothetical protein